MASALLAETTARGVERQQSFAGVGDQPLGKYRAMGVEMAELPKFYLQI